MNYKPIIITHCILFLFLSLVFALTHCCVSTNIDQTKKSLEKQINEIEGRVPINIEFVSESTKNSCHQDSLMKQFISSIEHWQNNYAGKLDNALLDIRQESNNFLSEVETMVTLWMGLLAIIGIFVPIIMQISYRHDMEKISEKIKSMEKISIKIKSMEEISEKISEKISIKIKSIEDNIEKHVILIEKNKISATIESFSCLHSISNSGSEDRRLQIEIFNQLRRDNIRNIYQLYRLDREKLNDDNFISNILFYLAKIRVLLSNLNFYYRNSRLGIRYVAKAQKQLQRLSESLIRRNLNTEECIDCFNNNLHAFQESLRSLPPID